MIIRVVRGENPFAQIDKRPLEDARLTYTARGIMAYLLTKPDSWEINIQEVVKNSPHGIHAIQTAFKELQQHGYAKLVNLKGDGGKLLGRKWVIYETSLSIEKGDNNRKGENCLVGDKTDEALFRSSVKPIIGKTDHRKSASISNNDFDTNNNFDSNNYFDSNSGGGGENFPKIEKSVAVEFAESELALNGLTKFKETLLGRGAPADFDPGYYYNRLLTWGAKSGIKPRFLETEWLQMALNFISGDAKRLAGYKKATQHATNSNGSPNGSSNGRSGAATDKKRAAAESAVRIAENVLARRAERSSFLSRINDQR